MPRAPLLDPALGREGVEVADVLGLADRVSCELDPDVRPPDFVAPSSAEEVAGKVPVAERNRSGSVIALPELLDLDPEVDVLGEQRLGRAVSRVAPLEQ